MGNDVYFDYTHRRKVLRMAGINVPTNSDILKIPGTPYLRVEITGLTTAGKGEALKQITSTISLMLFQRTILSRDSSISTYAITWSWGGYVYGLTNKDISNNIRSILQSCVDNFINAYLSVNPKGGK